MDPSFVQNQRYKLQKRASRLNSVDTYDSFTFTLTQFWRFFDRQPTFAGIIEILLTQFPEVEQQVEKIFNGEGLYGESEEEAAAIGYTFLRQLINRPDDLIMIKIIYHTDDSLETVREIFLDPFYEYVDEQLDDQRAMLALLMRYKQRSEWFHRHHLWQLSQTSETAEKSLALDLYSYLYDQGIDFAIEPSSVAGEIDLIAAQKTEDPLLLDAKIFDGAGRGKQYIRKGFNQIYTYTQHHNEPFGYLIIYNTSERDLRLSLKYPGNMPLILHNHKTIFLLTIDIHPYDKPVSRRSPLKATEITEEEFVEILEDNELSGNAENM